MNCLNGLKVFKSWLVKWIKLKVVGLVDVIIKKHDCYDVDNLIPIFLGETLPDFW